MSKTENLMNSIWFGEKSNLSSTDIKQRILKSETEADALHNLIELFKIGDFTQKPLLAQLMNQTKDEAVLNLCIRVFLAVAAHDDLKDPSILRFLDNADVNIIETFASAAVTSFSLSVIPYLLALLEEWEDINETANVIKDSIDFFLGFENKIGEEASIEEIGEYYFKFCNQNKTENYYFQHELVFTGDMAKKLIHRVMIAVKQEEPLRMELIPSLLSIYTGEKAPGDYNTIVNDRNYKLFVDYINRLSNTSWVRGQKYFYGYKI